MTVVVEPQCVRRQAMAETLKASRKAAAYQNTFRVAGWKGQNRNNERGSADKSVRVGNRTEFRPRKAHTKSRLGCSNCKRRKVKCDETREGGCLKCRQHGIDCDYSSPTNIDSESSTPGRDPASSFKNDSPSDDSDSSSMILYIPSQMGHLSPLNDTVGIASYLETFTHFERFTASTIGSDSGQRIFRSAILALAQEHDFLMHAVLGTAASHLSGLYPSDDKSPICLRFQKSAAYHWSHALPLYRKELSKEVSLSSMDALITTCMLLGIYFFQSSGMECSKSFVQAPSSQRDERLLWLSMQQGFGLLLRRLDGLLFDSTWFEVFMTASLPEMETVLDPENEQGMYAELLDLCEIRPNTTKEDNCYLPAVHDLFALLKADTISMSNFAQMMAFMGRLTGEFSVLLKRRDHRALLILLYWLALMHRLGMWWMKSRAASEGRAILQYLRHDPDPRMRSLLEWPTGVLDQG